MRTYLSDQIFTSTELLPECPQLGLQVLIHVPEVQREDVLCSAPGGSDRLLRLFFTPDVNFLKDGHRQGGRDLFPSVPWLKQLERSVWKHMQKD